MKLSDIIEFNPRETLSKGAIAKKIAMEKLEPFTRDIPEFEYLEFRGGTKFRNGDTLMARITPSLENGKTSKVNLLDEDEVGFGSTEFIVVRAKENISDENFVYYLMIAPNIREVAIKSMVGTSGRQRVQLDVVKNHEILCPPLKEQIRIGKILKALDDKIENNKKINHHLEQMAITIFESMFTNVSSGQTTIGKYIIPKRGKNLLSKDAIFGRVPVVAGGLQPSTFHNIANTEYPVLTISASGANAGYVNLWHVPVWASDSSYIDSKMTNNVYFWYVMLKRRQQEIYDSQTGSAQPHIYPKHIEIMPTIELSKKEINLFTKRVTPLFKTVGNNLEEINNLQNLRESLLSKLLSGEISVNQATK